MLTVTLRDMAIDGARAPPPAPPLGMGALPVAQGGPGKRLPGRPAEMGSGALALLDVSSVVMPRTSAETTPEPLRQAMPARRSASEASASMAVRETPGPVAVSVTMSVTGGAGLALGLSPASSAEGLALLLAEG